MTGPLKLPILKEILPGGLRFGANYLVEFEPQSLWYETSVTLCAQALRQGVKSDYHTFTRPPDDIKKQLADLTPGIRQLEDNDTFRLWDSYSVQTGLSSAQRIGSAAPRERVDLRSVKIEDWDRGVAEEVKGEVPEVEKQRLHIDDNTSVLLQFNDEKSVLNHFRTLTIPFARRLELSAIHSVATGLYQDSFYTQFESFCDGIIDFRCQEDAGKLVHYMRVRVARGAAHDSTWKRISLHENGEVRIDSVQGRPKEFGLTSWLKGPKNK